MKILFQFRPSSRYCLGQARTGRVKLLPETHCFFFFFFNFFFVCFFVD